VYSAGSEGSAPACGCKDAADDDKGKFFMVLIF